MAKFNWFDEQVFSEIKTSGELGMESACEFLKEQVQDSMKKGNYLPWPSKKRDGTIHFSSAPGTPPAPDTEELKKSISWAISNGKISGVASGDENVSAVIYGDNVNRITGRIGTTNEKGVRHELALTWHGVKRPFLRPALKINQNKIVQLLGKHKIK